MLQVVSAVMSIGILNVECAVRPSYKRTAAAADVATAISEGGGSHAMARVTNVFPVLPEASWKKTRDSAFFGAL